MIRIERDSINVVVVTLTEKVTITSPTFLFSFKSQENNTVNFIASDVSTQTERYNQFSIEEVGSNTGNIDYLNGKVQLLPQGQWRYTIYAQTSTTNLNPSLANEIVETGIVIVYDLDNPTVEYSEPSSNTDIYEMPNE